MIRNPKSSLKLPVNIINSIPDVSRGLSPEEVAVNWNKEFPTVVTIDPNPESRDLPYQTSSKQYNPNEYTFERTTIDTKDRIPSKSYSDKFTGATRNEEIQFLFNRPGYVDVLDRDPRYNSANVKAGNSLQTWVSAFPSAK